MRLKRSSRSEVVVDYDAVPQDAFCQDWETLLPREGPERPAQAAPVKRPPAGPAQLKLF